MKKLLAVAAVLPLLASCDRLETLVQQQPVQNADAQTKSDEQKKAEMALPDFAQLVEQVGASVVNIRVENESRNQQMDPFAELFRDLCRKILLIRTISMRTITVLVLLFPVMVIF